MIKIHKLKKSISFFCGIFCYLTTSLVIAEPYGPNGRVLADGETPAPNAICQSYGYGNVLQTRCFDAEPNNGVRDTPKTASKIDLLDTVNSATSGEHRTVYTYRDKSGILHYTENVPSEYKGSAKIFKKGTINNQPVQMIAYPKEYAGPAIPAENPSIGDDFNTPQLQRDKGISNTGTKERIKTSNKKSSNKNNISSTKKTKNNTKTINKNNGNQSSNKISKKSNASVVKKDAKNKNNNKVTSKKNNKK